MVILNNFMCSEIIFNSPDDEWMQSCSIRGGEFQVAAGHRTLALV